MKITSKNLFHLNKSTVSIEEHDDLEERYKKALNEIRSPIFQKFLKSLDGKTREQDYGRFLGLINLIKANLDKVPKRKKDFQLILSPEYLKGVPEDKIRDKVYNDLFSIYDDLKKVMKR